MSIRSIIILFVASFCAGCSLQSESTLDPSRTISGKIVRVSEGDLLHLRHHGQVTPIRLHGIDCPERGQAYSEQARYRAECLAKDEEVSVVVITHDLSGKTIGEVLLQNGISVNQELVASGHCWWYRQYAPSSSKLASLEETARAKHWGVWAQPNPIPPWVYRSSR